MSEGMNEYDVAVIGGGPGGYVAAFHAADLGLKAALIEPQERLGGVCLNVGCIPSKALLHAAQVVDEARHATDFGIHFSNPRIELKELRDWKEKVVGRLTGGLAQLAKIRGVEWIQASARFDDPHTLQLHGGAVERLRFRHSIVATGSRPATIAGLELASARILDSTSALDVEDVPASLLVIGGGYIGLELGTVYQALGSKVTVVEMLDGLLPGVDRDLVKPLARRIDATFEAVHLNTQVSNMKETKRGVEVQFTGEFDKKSIFQKVLIAVGRTPNSEELGLDQTGVQVEKGFIQIDRQCRTAEPSIFAIGDVVGQPMLAHKAMREGKVAAEVIAGQKSEFDHNAIPAVVFTNPEIAWTGLTEAEATQRGIEFEVARYPWAAASRSLTLGRTDGLTKMLFERGTGRVLGVGIVGPGAGELIAEGTLAVEMAAVAEDLALTIHPHPTLSETVGEVAEVFLGQAIHVYRKRTD